LSELRLELEELIDLEKLAREEGRLIAAAGLTLRVRAPVVRCSVLGLATSAPMPGSAEDDADDPSMVSRLPAGFVALDLHAQCVSMQSCGIVELATPGCVAHQLCMFFARAPASYRRFCLCCADSPRLRFCVAGVGGAWDPEAGNCREGRLTFDDVETLATLMQDTAAHFNMRAAVVEEPAKGVVVVTL